MYDAGQVINYLNTYEELINCCSLYGGGASSEQEKLSIENIIFRAKKIPGELKNEKFDSYINTLEGILALKMEKRYVVFKSTGFGRIIDRVKNKRKSFPYNSMNKFAKELKDYMETDNINLDDIQIAPSFSKNEKDDLLEKLKK